MYIIRQYKKTMKKIIKKTAQTPKPTDPVILQVPLWRQITKSVVWFSLGAVIGLFFFISFVAIFYQQKYTDAVHPGVFVNGVDFGGKSKEQVRSYFHNKNVLIEDTEIVFQADDFVASTSAKELQLGFDENLLAEQAFSIGRSSNFLSNTSLLLQAYLYTINLSPSYHYSDSILEETLAPLAEEVNSEPVDAVFNFEGGKVTTFKPSRDGQRINTEVIKQILLDKTVYSKSTLPPHIVLTVPVTTVKPNITTEKVNNMGIKELIATGTSLFVHSIENRIYNLTLAANKFNGVLIPPGEEFSFVKVVGDISSLSGYKQAYVIQNGKTVLGDGGGVCQVSTTMFRAALEAGLPITERNAHAYRVGYYEADSPPGIDAAIYTPSVDLKFRNDTGKYILIQTKLNPDEMRLTFEFYGTKDGRTVTIEKPVITSQSPAPEALYQDDPTLAKGVVKQVDFAAAGARVFFKRTVQKDGKVVLSDTFNSNYRPWQAIFLRGTKEN